MRCPSCQTINPPNAKFCLECGNRLLICPNCGTVNLPIAKFCIECGTPLLAKNDQMTPLASMRRTPAPTREDLTGDLEDASTEPEFLLPPEERRVVTVMFADITGSTPLADKMEPEDMRAILTGYFNLMAEQIRRHGGTVEKYIGDAVMAVFGAPLAHEDDPDRAIRAALDMQIALARFNEQRQDQEGEATRLQMRIGINTGEVAIPRDVRKRQDFLITGDAVNVAARLQQAASPDTILVGERTYLTTREAFEFRPIAPLHLKGKPEPIAASVVLGLRRRTQAVVQHPRGIEGREAPLVGRSLELTLMHANYARVLAERHPHLITILGTPGIGKSRLVHDFIAREQEKVKTTSSIGKPIEPRVLQGRCPPYGEGITYWPLIEILRSLLQMRDDGPTQDEESTEAVEQRFASFVKETLQKARRSESPEEITSTIIRSIGRALGNETEVVRTWSRRETPPAATVLKQSATQVAHLRAWRILLEALAEVQPLIIVVDDLHWADDALLDLLEYLTDRITSYPILFLCPARPDFFERRKDWGGGRRNFTTIELDALSRDESNDLIDELLNTGEIPEVLRNTILTRAEGNPFFVEEIVRMLIDQGILVRVEDSEHGESWCLRNGRYNEYFLGELSAPSERPDDTLINMHYILPLPRVPDTVQGVLAARVDLLKSVEKLILQHAAIIGRTFWFSSLLKLADGVEMERVLDALESLIARDFIVEVENLIRTPIEHDRVFSFKHILIRDVVYNNIPRMRRSQEHACLALWLECQVGSEKGNYVELLAYHYQQALATWSPGFSLAVEEREGLQTPTHLTRAELRQRAVIYLTMAGDQAWHSYYTTRALRAYNDAFEILIEGGAEKLALIKMHEKLGHAYTQRGGMDDAWQEFRKALRIATEGEQIVEGADVLCIYEHLAELATRWSFDTRPDQQEVRSYINAGLQLTQERPESNERAEFLTYLSLWYIRQAKESSGEQKAELAKHALTHAQEALEIAEKLNHPTVLSLIFDAIAFTYSQYHQYKEALDIQLRRLKLEEHLLNNREELFDLYNSLGSIYEQISDYPTSLRWLGRAWSNAQTMESPMLLLTSMVGRMRAWRQWNRWEEAQQVALEILQLIEREQQDERRQLWALETLSTIAYRRGNRDTGHFYERQFKRLLEQIEERSGGIVDRKLATGMHAIYLAKEDWSSALAVYKEKVQLNEPMPAPEAISTLTELMVATGENMDEVAALCERALQLAESSGSHKSIAITLRARGRMHMEKQDWNLAIDDLRQALQRCEVLDLPWEQGNTLYWLGMLYKRRANSFANSRRNADLNRSRYHLEKALGFFEAMKAQPGIDRVRVALMQDTPTRI